MTQHPLTENPWTLATDPEYGCVRLEQLRQFERTRHAIHTMARLVGNSLREPEASNAVPLDAWTLCTLLGGVESLCEHLGNLADALIAQALVLPVSDESDSEPAPLHVA